MAIGKLTNDKKLSASILPNGKREKMIRELLHLILSRKNINTGIGKTSFSNTIPTKRWSK
jgi:hypothetical protein